MGYSHFNGIFMDIPFISMGYSHDIPLIIPSIMGYNELIIRFPHPDIFSSPPKSSSREGSQGPAGQKLMITSTILISIT
jgi:hypothetical protein